MQFTVNTISLCGGGNHVLFDCTTPDGKQTIGMDWGELLTNDGAESDLIKLRLRSFAKDTIIGKNFMIFKLAVENKSFQI